MAETPDLPGTAPTPPAAPVPQPPQLQPQPGAHSFLVLVDETTQRKAALEYACRRARRIGGQVSLLWVIDTVEFQTFGTVEALMRQEAQDLAREHLHRLSHDVMTRFGFSPQVFVREGEAREVLIKLLSEQPQIKNLVLNGDTGSAGPGPLVTWLTGKALDKLHIPLTIVPANLSEEDLERFSA